MDTGKPIWCKDGDLKKDTNRFGPYRTQLLTNKKQQQQQNDKKKKKKNKKNKKKKLIKTIKKKLKKKKKKTINKTKKKYKKTKKKKKEKKKTTTFPILLGGGHDMPLPLQWYKKNLAGRREANYWPLSNLTPILTAPKMNPIRIPETPFYQNCPRMQIGQFPL